MDQTLKQRWRLVLGRFADKNLPNNILSKSQRDQDQALEQLYKKQLEKQGLRTSGTLDDSNLQVFEWLDKTEKLFPSSVNEKIQAHAIEEFGIKQILKNKKALSRMTPSIGLLKQILSIHNEIEPSLLIEIKIIIQKVVDDLLTQLKPKFQNKFSGRLNRHQSSPQAVLANLDWKKTIERNLKNYDRENKKLMLQRVYFNSRNQKHFPWRVILCIDQSGSMMESIIFSSVIAGILTKLPIIDLKLVLFDTNVIDLSEQADNPVEVLLSVQLGGGTHICKAWEYCAQLVEQPSRTVVATVSDFYEGGSPNKLVNQASEMMGCGIKMIGMTALTADALPFFDSDMTQRLSAQGMNITSLTPDSFANWLAQTMEL
ncbi:MAG: VWA domain-containing protein [Pseudomonadales bacterium]|nr:VWA domain-containing protein [Pseudomonadales bacterium]